MKVVIIGGGVAGLTAGVYARKAGWEVALYEKNALVGGECTGWDRQGFHIDNCVHWIMGMRPGTALYEVWRENGAVSDGVELLRSDHMYTSELGGERVTLWADEARTRRELHALSPEDGDAIDELLDDALAARSIEIPAEKPPELMGAADGLKMAVKMRQALRLFRKYRGMDTTDVKNRFRHPLLRAMISDFCPTVMGGYAFPMMYGNFLSGDGGTPRGGSRAMALRMGQRLEALGGRICTRAPVARLVVEDNRVQRALLESGESVEGDYFICACDPDFTFHHLLDPSYMDEMFRTVYRERETYPVFGMFQTAFAVDCPDDLLGGDVMLDCAELCDQPWQSKRLTVWTCAHQPEFAPPGHQVLQAIWFMSEAGWDFWSALGAEEYRARKNEYAARVQRKIEARWPDYAGRLRLLDSWTPVTYRRWCNAYKGYNQAYVATKHARENPYPQAWIPGLDNALHAGQWLSAPGGLCGAATQGKFAVQRIQARQK